MYEEMLPADIFTRPHGWQTHINIKHLLTDDNDIAPEQIKLIGKEIAGKLRRCSLFTDDEIIANFEQVDNLDEFNSIMDDMYGECDRVRILIK